MDNKYSILVGGDVFCKANYDNDLHNNNFHDFLELLGNSEFSIINLESPIINNAYSPSPIAKIGPSLYTDSKLLEIFKDHGLSGVTLANNHIMDYGKLGLTSTLGTLKDLKLESVGAGLDNESIRRPLTFTVANKTVTVINVAENEFSTLSICEGANAIDPIYNYEDIINYKKVSDFVIVVAHSGHEGYPLPSPWMKKLFHYYIDCGADAVIAHHSHCFSGYELYKHKHIFYGLGNLYFPWEKVNESSWNYGYLLGINIINDALVFTVIPYEQATKYSPGIKVYKENNLKFEEFKDKFNELSKLISDNDRLLEKYNEFILMQSKRRLVSFSPYSNRYLSYLARKKLIPRFLGFKKRLLLLNLFRCEAHRNVCIEVLRNSIKINKH